MVNYYGVDALERTRGGFLISKIHQVTGRIFGKLLKKAGIGEINHAQGRILFALWRKDGVPITELARETLLHKSTLTKMLDRLELSGLVVREPSAEDRRITVIRLTDRNRQLQEKYDRVSEEMRRIYYEGFSPSEIQQLDHLLSRVLDNLVAYTGQKQ